MKALLVHKFLVLGDAQSGQEGSMHVNIGSLRSSINSCVRTWDDLHGYSHSHIPPNHKPRRVYTCPKFHDGASEPMLLIVWTGIASTESRIGMTHSCPMVTGSVSPVSGWGWVAEGETPVMGSYHKCRSEPHTMPYCVSIGLQG